MGIPWSFKRNFTGAKEIKDTNDYLSKVGRAIGSLDSMPVGFNMPWWSDTLPSNKYMFMEGQSLANYPEARAVFGDYLPDLRNCTLVHKGSTPFDVVGNRVGEKTRTIATDNLPYNVIARVNSMPVGASCDTDNVPYSSGWANAALGDIGTRFGVPLNIIQPSAVCRYIAKVLP